MEISESSKRNLYSEAEENVLEPWKKSGKIHICSNDHTCRTRRGSQRSRGGGRKRSDKRESVSDLEAEETKGFVDLGFVFTEEDLNTELSEILPGLRTFLCQEEQRKTEPLVKRPYLSETWDYYENDEWRRRPEKDSVVVDLRMAALSGEEIMKDSLKWWARSVASNLK